ncbi:MAG TPA: 50S ribosomal protein L17 [Campylobacterales bacterium]|nr:50S ribosomal protein L17 [Campylobacterales bacterium]HIO71387.1 50S ribosomal protein L17 [Campylobacterales bacterium]
MRHKHGYRKLNRTSSHRKALLKNLAIAVINEGRIETTVAKAKTLRSFVEKLITKAREGNFNSHRAVFQKLQNKEATKKLMNEIAPRFVGVNGGYVRVVKTRNRRGDSAPMAIVEFTKQ